jgi:hypothetical protein
VSLPRLPPWLVWTMIQGVQLFSSVIILREEWRIYRRLWTKVWVRVRGRAGVLCVARYRRSSAHTHTPPLNSFFPRCACARDASVLSAGCAGVVPRGVFCAFMRTCVFPRQPVANCAHLRLHISAPPVGCCESRAPIANFALHPKKCFRACVVCC